MSLTTVLISIALVGLSAFFVAAEFSLLAARTYRLEEAAATSRSGRAALRSARELTVLLAGAQLGITLCTLGLGAVAKPAVDYSLRPVLEGWGLASPVAAVVSFILALIIVTFIHLVVGEMAPKSWAISHPEKSAIMLALPMRGFIVVTRPLLLAMNGTANWLLRRVRVDPVDEVAAGRTPDDLRQLVDFSAAKGSLDPQRRDRLMAVLELERTPISTLAQEPDGVDAGDDVTRIRQLSRETNHLRLVVRDHGDVIGFVHVRDTLDRPAATTARELLRPILRLPGSTPYHSVLNAMREKRSHLALITHDDRALGIVTLTDLVDQLLDAEYPPDEARTSV